ncbi:ribonucleoside-diphosphate reductase 1 subunit beta [Vibrio phage vB_VmeM-32]|nr:ribonucleoside-diphosphate reductase 1 subunit beta [Vibrio phage vB_VmeM-32]
MSTTIFNKNNINHLEQPLFFGDAPNVSRFETTKHNMFESLTERSLSFFWRPEEFSLTDDGPQFQKMSEAEQHVFTSNLKYQTLLDSVQGRAPNIAFLPIVSDVSLENWIATWSFSETIHSRSYTHIIRNVYTDPSSVFDEIMLNDAIMKRAESVTKYYDELINLVNRYNVDSNSVSLTKIKEMLYLVMHSVNALEAIRFYVSFACSFSFGQRGIMEGNSKIIKSIARDEALHLKGTQYILNLWHSGKDDPEMKEIAERLKPQAEKLFLDVYEQEREWIDYLLSKGDIPLLNKEILTQYLQYVTGSKMRAVGLNSPFNVSKNPIPWIRDWLNSSHVQVTPQEVEISAYLISQMDMNVTDAELKSLSIS